MKYVCQICGYVYDNDVEKIPFEELPNSWKCPLCGASKDAFKKEEEKKVVKKERNNVVTDDMKKIDVGQIAVIFSNLSRGCEKQYLVKESKLYKDLAEYFTNLIPDVEKPDIDTLADMIDEDVENYPYIKENAQIEKDRGALRAYVWGEKVTRMIASLLSTYKKEGENMFKDNEIWICSVCGFIYLGKKPPELCPVCKVPEWKFEKITEGK